MLSEGCLEDVLRVSGRCFKGVWRVSMRHPNVGCLDSDTSKEQVSTGQVRTGKVKSVMVQSGQVK